MRGVARNETLVILPTPLIRLGLRPRHLLPQGEKVRLPLRLRESPTLAIVGGVGARLPLLLFWEKVQSEAKDERCCEK